MDAITQVNVHFNVRSFFFFFFFFVYNARSPATVKIKLEGLVIWARLTRLARFPRSRHISNPLKKSRRVNMGRWSGSVPEIFPIWTLWLGYWDEFFPTTRVTDLAAGGARPQTTWTAMAASEQISSSSKSKTFCQRRDMISNLIECLNDFKSKIE